MPERAWSTSGWPLRSVGANPGTCRSACTHITLSPDTSHPRIRVGPGLMDSHGSHLHPPTSGSTNSLVSDSPGACWRASLRVAAAAGPPTPSLRVPALSPALPSLRHATHSLTGPQRAGAASRQPHEATTTPAPTPTYPTFALHASLLVAKAKVLMQVTCDDQTAPCS